MAIKKKIDLKRFVKDKLLSLNEECVYWSRKIKESSSEEDKRMYVQDLIKVNCQQFSYAEIQAVIDFNVDQNKSKIPHDE